jgi:predicted nuclease of predicted toxin-antitoxin system
MKILLDENLPRKLKTDFVPDFEVKTVGEMDWLGKKTENC